MGDVGRSFDIGSLESCKKARNSTEGVNEGDEEER